ncbi:hypothetical protein MARPO_0008s0027 [Marchantia polymorpha]|uniref:Uncharacterized protein n=1 Tax=Marchantia polymorpha TaxID=3197 RepID=A0A2R6XMB5_MARPO|nr:hypothetical protein MARPO_0008s0027 [Marchantia polymorpha]|eukprot:PTQ47240.1 hypothetical protein MARPO_0008s0027 [Marchantia polymorpha]
MQRAIKRGGAGAEEGQSQRATQPWDGLWRERGRPVSPRSGPEPVRHGSGGEGRGGGPGAGAGAGRAGAGAGAGGEGGNGVASRSFFSGLASVAAPSLSAGEGGGVVTRAVTLGFSDPRGG